MQAVTSADGTALEPLARTLPYDLADTAGDVPASELAGLTVPGLILGGGNSPAWFRRPVAEQAAAIPCARLTGAGDPILASFFSAGVSR